MSLEAMIRAGYRFFLGLTKKKLIEVIVRLRDEYIQAQAEIDKLQGDIIKLKGENAQLKEALKQQQIQTVNNAANKPSSKQAEWEAKGSQRQQHQDNDQRKKKKRTPKPRTGAGNQRKPRQANRTETATVEQCDRCGKDLRDKPALNSTNERIIEDIPEPEEQPDVVKIIQEKKYCDDCKHVVTAKSERALPGADIGLSASVLICYLWVALCLPYTRIKEYLNTCFGLEISTAGLSSHVVRIAALMRKVHEEIRLDIQVGVTLFADETGWRVRGKNWWLWVFGTERSAYYTVDRTRGSDVVRRVLGEIFIGVLVVDGWSAYLSLICEQQTCMAHVFRKIRKFREAFPHLVDIAKFYVKLRRILRDGEQLQGDREALGEAVFQRRLKRLHKRLEDLVNWPNPDEVLEEIIKKVKRQQPRMLTFVEHPGVPTHNNYAEYLIRIGVLKRKISGGSVSAEGANAYAILLSIYTTCRLRGISFPRYLKASLQHHIKTGKPLSIEAYANQCHVDVALKKAA
ncbi:MAG: IS66 family transposase [Anaerolineales bacterium]